MVQSVKQHKRLVTELYKGLNNVGSWLRSGTMGQTTAEVCYGVLQRVKEHHRFVTEWYKGSNNIGSMLRCGTKGETTQEDCYGVV